MSEQTPGTNGRRVYGLDAGEKPRERRELVIPGYEDGVFIVQEITYQERMDAAGMSKAEPRNGKGPAQSSDDKLLIPRIVAQGWIDESGRKVVEHPEGGSHLIARLGSRVVMTMFNNIADLSAFSPEAREDLGKDSKAMPSASGTSTGAAES